MNKRQREHWVPTVAAAAVAVAALGAVIMAKRGDDTAPTPPMVGQTSQFAASEAPAAQPSASSQSRNDAPSSPAGQAAPVVKAPPLKPPPKPPATSFARSGASIAQPGSGAMGSQAACGNCGTIETVVAVLDDGKPSGYQMHIRMDDGTQRMVEQRGALAAGSRVRVEGRAVRALGQDS